MTIYENGVRIIFSSTGKLGRFDFSTLIVKLTSIVVLMSAAQTIVHMIAPWIYPRFNHMACESIIAEPGGLVVETIVHDGHQRTVVLEKDCDNNGVGAGEKPDLTADLDMVELQSDENPVRERHRGKKKHRDSEPEGHRSPRSPRSPRRRSESKPRRRSRSREGHNGINVGEQRTSVMHV